MCTNLDVVAQTTTPNPQVSLNDILSYVVKSCLK